MVEYSEGCQPAEENAVKYYLVHDHCFSVLTWGGKKQISRFCMNTRRQAELYRKADSSSGIGRLSKERNK